MIYTWKLNISTYSIVICRFVCRNRNTSFQVQLSKVYKNKRLSKSSIKANFIQFYILRPKKLHQPKLDVSILHVQFSIFLSFSVCLAKNMVVRKPRFDITMHFLGGLWKIDYLKIKFLCIKSYSSAFVINIYHTFTLYIVSIKVFSMGFQF